jgi:16S rRNA (cytidine1402-2'-O)-methyltransferase
MNGTLYIVATPIGNLEDMTFRAVRILGEVDLIACEDTRTTGVLLRHYNIHKPTTSYFEHNEVKKIPYLIEQLNSGKSLAVVSEAGTPTISDPAFKLVRAAQEQNIPVVGIPGATAAVLALSISGLPTDRFVFEGFLPHKKGRLSRWQELKSENRTIILYESPYRVIKTIQEVRTHCPGRLIVIARELTKKFEEIIRGTPEQLLEHFLKHTPRGEFVILIAGKKYSGLYNTETNECPEDSSDDPDIHD